jgi:hypothetical protein
MTTLQLHNEIVQLMNRSKLNAIELYGVITPIEAIMRLEVLNFYRDEQNKKENKQ